MLDWFGCYDGGWKGLIVPEAFAHPAKFSYRLIQRIYVHGLKEGYWKPLDLIGDPFGGVGLGGICAAYAGLKWVGVELEPRFVNLAAQNFNLHRYKWALLESVMPVILQGDSRRFASLVGCDSIVTSPPYANPQTHDRNDKKGTPGMAACEAVSPAAWKPYGTTPGQIGALKAGELDAVVTSPPFSEPGSQPPNVRGARPVRSRWAEQPENADSYGHSEGQIGALPSGRLDGVVTSPPFETTEPYQDKNFRLNDGRKALPQGQDGYGKSTGQIGNDTGETYWQAVAQVYAQCKLAMKPGGIMAMVVKDYVKAGKRVPLCDQTCQLLESLGFKVFERCRAWLVKEETNPGLFGEVTEKTERKSFFRRLAEKKGSPRIDWEEVIWARG